MTSSRASYEEEREEAMLGSCVTPSDGTAADSRGSGEGIGGGRGPLCPPMRAAVLLETQAKQSLEEPRKNSFGPFLMDFEETLSCSSRLKTRLIGFLGGGRPLWGL
ncbi:hypothetical protein cyc_06527 [Cyclospora cayetanensis]|uniref:Uncharacterized protein n=1 Tax=Cyclospora cayetanensis TaxID=88456 RepID=A0A1D3D512_9EIME|nr:hypothetical protein cyc_06527 [Cyclospora cayetanensis]